MMNRMSTSKDTKAAKQATKLTYSSMAFRVGGTILAITLLIVVLLHSLGMPISEFGHHVVASFVYSTLIAAPSIFLLEWIGRRYTERFPRLVILLEASVLVCMAILGCFAAGLVFQWIGVFPREAYWREFRSSAEFAILISLMAGMSITTYETMRYKLQATTLELRTRQVEQERAYKLLAEAQLSSLESRIHPHFLFNTLNSIAALIPKDPQLAEDTVGKLASLLRFSLSANQSRLVSLGQELKIVRDYLEIEKTRFGARLSYEIAIPDTLLDSNVPPLALQSLVENTVKHVVSRRSQGAMIQISGSCKSGQIVLEVIDDGPGFSLDAIQTDHGLGNLIARLDILFGDAGLLNVTRTEGKTAVRLSFPA